MGEEREIILQVHRENNNVMCISKEYIEQSQQVSSEISGLVISCPNGIM